MRTLNLRPAGLCLLFVLAAAGPSAAQDARTAGPAGRAGPWSLGLGVHGFYESNVLFAPDEGANSGDFGSRFLVSLGRGQRLGRGTFSFSVDASQLMYRKASALDQFQYTGGVGVSQAITPRLVLRISDSFTSGYAQESSLLTGSGVVFPRVVTRTNQAFAGLTYSKSRRSQLNFDVSTRRVIFDDSTLTDSQDVTLRLSFSRQMTRTQSLGFNGGHTFTSGTTGDIQGLNATYQLLINEFVTLDASGGIRPYTVFGESGFKVAPGGLVGLTVLVDENNSGSITYERAVEQAYGFDGTHHGHRINGFFERRINGRLSVTGAATYGRNWYPSRADYILIGRTVAAGASYRVVRGLSLEGNYSLLTSKESDAGASTSRRAGVSVTYDLAWR